MGMVKLDQKTPLYLQVKARLQQNLQSGKYQRGDKLEAEQVLARSFGVSRPTIRRAIKQLIDEGLLKQEQGRGTFVAREACEKMRLTLLVPDYHADLIVRKMAQVYELQNPRVEMNVVSAPYEAIHEHFHVEFMYHSGSIDVIMVPFSFMPEYISNGKLEVLDNYIDAMGPEFFQDWISGSVGSSVIADTCGLRVPGVGQKYFGLPFQNDVYVLAYRRDLLDKYGLSAPRNYQEYLAVAQTLTGATDAAGNRISYGTVLNAKRATADLAEDFIGFLWDFSGDLFDNNLEPIINSPAGRQALNAYKSLLEFSPPGSVDYSVFDAIRTMARGEAGMIHTWSSLVGLLEDPARSEVAGKLGYTPFPSKSPQVAGWELAIPFDSPNKQLAFDFISFATGTSKVVGEIFADSGVLPYRCSVLSKPELAKKNPCAALVKDAWSQGRCWGRFKENRALMEVTSLYASYALTNVLTVEQALDEVAKAYATLVRKDIELTKILELRNYG